MAGKIMPQVPRAMPVAPPARVPAVAPAAAKPVGDPRRSAPKTPPAVNYGRKSPGMGLSDLRRPASRLARASKLD